MKYVMIVAALVGMVIGGASVASARTGKNFHRAQQGGYNQCITDEGNGRYTSCDGGS